jgi:hypothetical protein
MSIKTIHFRPQKINQKFFRPNIHTHTHTFKKKILEQINATIKIFLNKNPSRKTNFPDKQNFRPKKIFLTEKYFDHNFFPNK